MPRRNCYIVRKLTLCLVSWSPSILRHGSQMCRQSNRRQHCAVVTRWRSRDQLTGQMTDSDYGAGTCPECPRSTVYLSVGGLTRDGGNDSSDGCIFKWSFFYQSCTGVACVAAGESLLTFNKATMCWVTSFHLRQATLFYCRKKARRYTLGIDVTKFCSVQHSVNRFCIVHYHV
jgi:hypothetical protein